MKKKRNVVDKNMDSYKIPSKEILRHRSEFFSLCRRSDDKTATWLKRVQNCIHRCEFPTSVSKFLLIDRFVCGLNANELASFKRSKYSWTLENLLEHFLKDTAYIEATINEGVHQIENITLAVVKPEPETPEKNISSDDEQQAFSEEVYHEMLNSDIDFESEDNKLSVKDVAATVTSTITDDPIIETSAFQTIDTGIIINEVDKILSRNSVEKESIKNDQKKCHRNIAAPKNKFVTPASTINAAPTPSDAVIASAIGLTIDNVDKNHLNIIGTSFTINNLASSTIAPVTTKKEPNKNDKLKQNTDDSAVSHAVNVSIGGTIDDANENLSDSSFEEQPSENYNQRYRITHDGKNRFVCKQCNRECGSLDKVLLHIRSVHDGIHEHACTQCDKRCSSANELRMHNRLHTGERPFICDQCGLSYARRNVLVKHIKTVHLGLRPHVCQICDKRFAMKSKLEKHLVIHTGEKPFVCDQCGKSFNRSDTLKTHQKRVHQQIQPHACPICCKRFCLAAELKKHSRSHTGERPRAKERPHACDQCDKTFLFLNILKKHKNTVHEGIRPHACLHCEKRFKTRTHLKQHLTMHTGEKRYTCDQCSKSFALGHHLSSHKKSVHQ